MEMIDVFTCLLIYSPITYGNIASAGTKFQRPKQHIPVLDMLPHVPAAQCPAQAQQDGCQQQGLHR